MKTASELRKKGVRRRPEVNAHPSKAPRGDEELGRKLRELRLAFDLPLTAVAGEVGITYAQLSAIEVGKSLTGLRNLAALAVFYDTTLDDLAGHMVAEAIAADSAR